MWRIYEFGSRHQARDPEYASVIGLQDKNIIARVHGTTPLQPFDLAQKLTRSFCSLNRHS